MNEQPSGRGAPAVARRVRAAVRRTVKGAVHRAAAVPAWVVRAQRAQVRLMRSQLLAAVAVQRVTVEVTTDLWLRALDGVIERLGRVRGPA
jgi:hypothetical protein